jgi:hypothetical protein
MENLVRLRYLFEEIGFEMLLGPLECIEGLCFVLRYEFEYNYWYCKFVLVGLWICSY